MTQLSFFFNIYDNSLVLNAFENLGNPQEIPRNPENLVILGDFENLVRYFEK